MRNLGKVVKVRQLQVDRAARNLSDLRERELQARNQQHELESMLAEYVNDFREITGSTLSATNVANKLRFHAQLNSAVEVQANQVMGLQQQFQRAESVFIEAWVKQKALSRAQSKRDQIHIKAEEKRQQRRQVPAVGRGLV